MNSSLRTGVRSGGPVDINLLSSLIDPRCQLLWRLHPREGQGVPGRSKASSCHVVRDSPPLPALPRTPPTHPKEEG